MSVRYALIYRCPLSRRVDPAAGDVHTPGPTFGPKARRLRVVGLRPHLSGPGSILLEWRGMPINPSLMASAVLSSTSVGTFCHLCQEVDHQATDCAMAALDPAPHMTNPSPHRRSFPQPSARRANRPSPYDLSVEVCRRFNWGQCPDPSVCCFRHVCSYPDCKCTTHGAIACPLHSEAAKAGAPSSSGRPPGPTITAA